MKDLDSLLRAWELSGDDRSIERSYEDIIRRLERIIPGNPGQESLDLLILEDLVECTWKGEYILTERGIRRRRALGDEDFTPAAEDTPNGEGEWARFRRLVRYFSDCVRFQEKAQEYLSPKDLNKGYIIPLLPADWLRKGREIFSVELRREEVSACNYLVSHCRDGRKAYIGYPVEIFRSTGGELLCTPVALIPAELMVDFSSYQLDLKLDPADVGLNTSWIEYKIPREEKEAFIQRIYTASGNTGELNFESILPVLAVESGADVRKFKPSCLDYVWPSSLQKQHELCNVAVLCVSTQPKYSGTLLNELEFIANQPADCLDQTALAYVFREHPKRSINSDEPEKVPLPFISSNDEQREAVAQALNQRISKVTGPPGTGKSQVAVNLIANLVYRGKSVLFASRNHKAVSAIADRSLSLMEGKRLPLVYFNKLDPQDSANSWYKQDLEDYEDRAASDFVASDEPLPVVIKDAEEQYLELEKWYAERNDIQEEMKCRLNELEAAQKNPYITSAERDTPDEALLSTLHKAARQAYESQPPRGFSIRSLIQGLLWALRGKKRQERQRAWISQHFGKLIAPAHSDEGRSKRIASYLKACRQYKERKAAYEEVCLRAKSLPSVSEGLPQLGSLIDNLHAMLKPALVYELSRRAARLHRETEEGEAIIDEVKASMSLFKRSNRPFIINRMTSEELGRATRGYEYFSQCFPAWACTLLSLPNAVPCLPSIIDHVIIDEAAQCDIAPLIPALYRAKSATLIGDPKQFPPIITLTASRNSFLKARHGLSSPRDLRYDYADESAYSVVNAAPVILREHFRCHEDIVSFCNEVFYRNQLQVRTDSEKLRFPAAFGFTRAIDWVETSGEWDGDLEEVHALLQRLRSTHYPGDVGIITPYRQLANLMKERFAGFSRSLNNFLVNTVNAFQGGERDLIIFVLGYHDKLDAKKKWYVEDMSNRYIFNVAISRARACALIVGNRKLCRDSGVEVLQKLAAYPRAKDTNIKPTFESVWEERLWKALLAAGITTQPQRSLLGRRLDMAYESANYKLDIEVDGVRYHKGSVAGRKLDDHFRDLQVSSAGWDVIRFWVYELQEDMDRCVKAVKDRIRRAAASS